MTQNNIREFKLYLLNYKWSSLYRIDNEHDDFNLFIYMLENSKKMSFLNKNVYNKFLFK